MSIDEVDLGSRMLKYCPSCGNKDIAIYGQLLKCHKCFKVHSAMEIGEEFGE